jgi:hypothetical protein
MGFKVVFMRKFIFLFVLVILQSLVFAQPWDFFRPLIDITQIFSVAISSVALVVSAVILYVSILAVKKNPSKKIKIVFLAFGLFFLKLLFSFLDIYLSPGDFMNGAIRSFFDLAIMVCLFVAIFQK